MGGPQRRTPHMRLASADSLPYGDEHFDLVISCHALEHLPDAVCHNYDDALHDIELSASLLHDKGWMILHDTGRAGPKWTPPARAEFAKPFTTSPRATPT